MSSKAIIGVNILRLGDRKPQIVAKCLSEVVRDAESGKLNPVVKETYTVDELNRAHLALEKRSSIGKVAVFWD